LFQVLALKGEWEKARVAIEQALAFLHSVGETEDANAPMVAYAHSSQSPNQEAESLLQQSILLQLTVGLHLGHDVRMPAQASEHCPLITLLPAPISHGACRL
jgi:hypothetical protein